MRNFAQRADHRAALEIKDKQTRKISSLAEKKWLINTKQDEGDNMAGMHWLQFQACNHKFNSLLRTLTYPSEKHAYPNVKQMWS